MRWYSHLSSARHNRANKLLYNTMRKYGIETFTFEILHIIDDRATALKKETECIEVLQTHYSVGGLNITYGGEIGNVGCIPWNKGSVGKMPIAWNKGLRDDPRCKWNDSARQQQSNNHAGSKNPNARKYSVTLPCGTVIISNCLKETCHEHNLSYSGLRNTIRLKKPMKSGAIAIPLEKN